MANEFFINICGKDTTIEKIEGGFRICVVVCYIRYVGSYLDKSMRFSTFKKLLNDADTECELDTDLSDEEYILHIYHPYGVNITLILKKEKITNLEIMSRMYQNEITTLKKEVKKLQSIIQDNTQYGIIQLRYSKISGIYLDTTKYTSDPRFVSLQNYNMWCEYIWDKFNSKVKDKYPTLEKVLSNINEATLLLPHEEYLELSKFRNFCTTNSMHYSIEEKHGKFFRKFNAWKTELNDIISKFSSNTYRLKCNNGLAECDIQYHLNKFSNNNNIDDFAIAYFPIYFKPLIFISADDMYSPEIFKDMEENADYTNMWECVQNGVYGFAYLTLD